MMDGRKREHCKYLILTGGSQPQRLDLFDAQRINGPSARGSSPVADTTSCKSTASPRELVETLLGKQPQGNGVERSFGNRVSG